MKNVDHLLNKNDGEGRGWEGRVGMRRGGEGRGGMGRGGEGVRLRVYYQVIKSPSAEFVIVIGKMIETAAK